MIDNLLPTEIESLSNESDLKTLGYGAWLWQVKRHKHYLDYDHPSFNSFTAQQSVSKGRSKKQIEEIIEVYDIFMERWAFDADYLANRGLANLIKLLPVVKDVDNKNEVQDWLDLTELSRKDLLDTIREARGKPQMPVQQATSSPGSSCILHPERPAEQAHWPITKKMGGKNVLPLCRECHGELHQQGDVTFYFNYKRKIGEWLALQQTAGR